VQEDKKACILLGYSGHAYVVAEAYLLSGGHLDGYADRVKNIRNPFALEYAGSERDDVFPFWKEGNNFILGVGDNKLRHDLGNFVRENGGNCLTVIHPASSISSMSIIGSGSFIARNVAVNPLCEIGNDVILNTSCSIDHECRIESGAHIAPGAVLAGNVIIGKRSFIGANSVIKQGVIIGEDVVIGAGSVVLNDIPSNTIVVGNPAKILNHTK